MTRRPYTFQDIVAAYASLGLPRSGVVYVVSDIGLLMHYAEPGREAVLTAHLAALREVGGEDLTVVVPTASMNLLGTDTVFSLSRTPAYRVGVFSEHVRRLPSARRSFHPFNSYAALGPQASAIVDDVSRHGYGWGSPEARMIDLDATVLSIGVEPRMSASTTHHVEQVMTVPYRYVKEFRHPVERNGAVVEEYFYMYLMYRESDVQGLRNFGLKLFGDFTNRHPGAIRSARLGKGQVHAYSMREYFRSACETIFRDPYAWCDRPPAIRPWQS
ncbi:aminoglycoside 3-N-acetyltransferase [Roseospirillum parvum]|uniref:Aminoglycoside N(3)-acetyltransferase n=2 Tax=Roseospirillum parvum TaxID=83401 RepID=A0A1G7UZZ0_9PROT|nr:aminoglycoside 3-N-acetyltransferase [Roseospirillum parvum]